MHSAASQTPQLRLASIRVPNENRFQIYCYILPGHENQQDARGLKPSVGNVKMELQKNKTKTEMGRAAIRKCLLSQCTRLNGCTATVRSQAV